MSVTNGSHSTVGNCRHKFVLSDTLVIKIESICFYRKHEKLKPSRVEKAKFRKTRLLRVEIKLRLRFIKLRSDF